MPAPEIKQGDVYWVDIPPNQTVGSEQYDRRPYVIVSRTAINKVCRTVVGVPLTTSVGPTKPIQHPLRVLIPVREIVKDVGYSGEIKISLAKTDQVRVLDKSRLGPRMGALSATATATVGGGLAYLFDIR
jgi:mRNA-degrading endonuclease toxin of MazEF toxin-antitoxin module